MTALLADNLPLLAGAPNGIKKLRELILELAVRGKLVPQDPADEPASELLKRIAAEKARLVAEGKIRKLKTLVEIDEEEMPFNVAINWEWVRVAAVGHDWGQKTPDKAFTYIDVGAINNTVGKISTPQVLMAQDAPSRARKVVRLGTVIYSTIRPYLLNVAVIDKAYEQEAIASTAFSIIHPFLEMPARYFLYYLRSPVFVRYVESVQMGIAYPAINDGQFFSGLIPLPPLAEQHRIVAKIDELMALCDRLEAQQADAESAHTQLVQALLDSLTQANDATEFAANWQRLAEHFHTLFTTESSIDALKQTLLQLAVMGKLVPQDPNDEPATELLKRITREMARRVAEGKLKKQKPLTKISDEEKLFGLPAGWMWARLEEISHVFSGNAFKSEDFQEGSGTKVIKITNAGVGEFIKTNDYLPTDYAYEHVSFRVLKGDLILALTRPYISTGLKISKCPAEYDGALLNQRVAAIRLYTEMNNKFGFLFFKSPIVLAIYQERFGNSGLQPNLKIADVTSLVIPIPSLAEQQRIVAKVDQLMALCDQLKSRLTQARQVNEQLASTLIEQAVA